MLSIATSVTNGERNKKESKKKHHTFSQSIRRSFSTKFCTMIEVVHAIISAKNFKVKRLKVKVTRPISIETESVSPTNFKLGRRLQHEL